MKNIWLKAATGLLFTALAFTGCSSDPDEMNAAGGLSIDEEYLATQIVEKGQTTLTIPVKTRLADGQWTVKSSDDSWCLADKAYGMGNNIKIVALASEEPDVREATVTVRSTEGASYTIKIKQFGYGPAILLDGESQSIAADGGTVDIIVRSNIELTAPVIKHPDGVEPWLTLAADQPEPESRGFISQTVRVVAAETPSFNRRSATVTFTAAEYETESVCTVIQQAKSGTLDDIDFATVKLVPVESATSTQAHAGSEIEYSFDGDRTTVFHSPWQYPYDNPGTVMPVQLHYVLSEAADLEYIMYYNSNGNGKFGLTDIYYNKTLVEGGIYPEYIKANGVRLDWESQELKTADGVGGVMTINGGGFDLGMQSAVKIELYDANDQLITGIKDVEFTVYSGSTQGGDNSEGGFAVCQEMEFYESNMDQIQALYNKLLTVFTDLSCSELKEGVTEAMINNLPGYYAVLGFKLFNNEYNEWEKDFRIQTYKPYSDAVQWSETLHTNKYSQLNNPVGMYGSEGQKLIIMVDKIPASQSVYLEVVDGITTSDVSGKTFALQQGTNQITLTDLIPADDQGDHNRACAFFIRYIVNTQSAELSSFEPVKVHICDGGTVNGYFDLERHQTDEKYAELLAKATYKYFTVRGKDMIFNFHKSKMTEFVPSNIVSAIELWDDIVRDEISLMGIDDERPSRFNNHMYAVSSDDPEVYMNASDYRVMFNYTSLYKILLRENVMADYDNVWGPAHEIGHCNQEAINWAGCTENSNNLFSNFILYRLGKYCSRGEEISGLVNNRFVDKKAWAEYSNELKMRMNWQLWNYFHRLGNMSDFWPKLFQYLRANPLPKVAGGGEFTPGGNAAPCQMAYVEAVCAVANMDLTDFFDMWGFFTPYNKSSFGDYSYWKYTVTEDMIAATKAKIAQYPAPKAAFQYLEDRRSKDEGADQYTSLGDVGHYDTFKANTKITKNVSYTLVGQTITITDGSEAVAFEVYLSGKLAYASNFMTFTVPSSINLSMGGTLAVKAVQADGERKECTKK